MTIKAINPETKEQFIITIEQDECVESPLTWEDPVETGRPLFVLTNHRRYEFGDNNAEEIAWDMLKEEPDFNHSWLDEDHDVLSRVESDGTLTRIPDEDWRQEYTPSKSRIHIYVKKDDGEWAVITDSEWSDYVLDAEDNPNYLGGDLPGLMKAASACRDVYILPVYMYDHSGITIRTTPFNCNFDSGLLGFIMWTDKQIEKYYAGADNLPASTDNILKAMRSWVDILDQYVSGDVWYLQADSTNGETSFSMGGLYGYEYALQYVVDALELDIIEGE